MPVDVQTGYELRPFRYQDVLDLTVQSAQSSDMVWLRSMTEDEWREIEESGRAFTGVKDGRILGFAGTVEFWPSRVQGWALLSAAMNRADMLWVHRQVQKHLDELPDHVKRIEMTVHAYFNQGHKWARMLGFLREGHMPCYDQNGNDHILYGRIRK